LIAARVSLFPEMHGAESSSRALDQRTVDVDAIRRRFSSLRDGFAYLDAPGGSQVPDEVGEAVAAAMREASGNLGARYTTGERINEVVRRARDDAARFVGGSNEEIVFGANMTSLNFSLTRAASRDWKEGDRILVSRLDHEGGVAPWLQLADDRGFVVDWVDVTDELTLDFDDLERKLDDRVRVLAFVLASNAVGTVTDAKRASRLAAQIGALSWVDAVHYAPHEPIDVKGIECDVLLCSPYKFCGPHLGLAHIRRELIESWRPYKVRPKITGPAGRRFETGTPPFELLAGFSATVDYLESLGGIRNLMTYERELGRRFLEGAPESVTIYGLQTMNGRLPTFLFNVRGFEAAEVVDKAASAGYGVWSDDNWYALGLRDRLPYPHEAVRVGFIHYNTAEEVDGFLEQLHRLNA
jgi:cysteine desulfurase family protein (TIGR01976 family)